MFSRPYPSANEIVSPEGSAHSSWRSPRATSRVVDPTRLLMSTDSAKQAPLPPSSADRGQPTVLARRHVRDHRVPIALFTELAPQPQQGGHRLHRPLRSARQSRRRPWCPDEDREDSIVDEGWVAVAGALLQLGGVESALDDLGDRGVRALSNRQITRTATRPLAAAHQDWQSAGHGRCASSMGETSQPADDDGSD